MATENLIDTLAERLAAEYPDTTCPLHHQNAFELLVATILSAQCTDERVNKETPALFARFPTAEAMAAAPLEEIEEGVRRINFWRNKAKNLKGMATRLVEEHRGEVPSDMDALVALPGVGRKTANVVRQEWFRIPEGFVVDTHVKRVARRLGLTEEEDAEKVEQDMMALVSPERRIEFHTRMIFHGRQICDARKPACDRCPLADLCPSARSV